MLSLKLTCLRSLYRKDKILSPQLRHLLCNALIYTASFTLCMLSLVPQPQKKNSKQSRKLFKTNVQLRFCLQLDNKAHVGITEFKHINWLPVNYRFRQCLAANVFKFFDDKCPLYMKDVLDKPCISQASTRNSTMKLSQPLRRTNNGQHCYISFLWLYQFLTTCQMK